MLMVFRVFQGIGFGGEWAVGAVLVAELVRPESRGKALGVIQSAWAVGWALAVVAYRSCSSCSPTSRRWRMLMCLGILPALLILYVRRNVEDPEVFSRGEGERDDERRAAAEADLPRATSLKTTIFASLLATGIQGGYYAMFTWIPTYLKEEREPDRRRHERLPVRGHRRRLPRLPERGLRARPPRPPQDASRCSRRWRASRWSRTSSCRAARTRRC